jgi:hypothetical protein
VTWGKVNKTTSKNNILLDSILTSSSLAHQEKNVMSYNPFENIDDALFHDCGNEESC